MLARISCPACQNQFSIPEGEMGTRQVCGKCHSPFIAGKALLVAQGAANSPSGPAPAFNRTMLADAGPDIKFNCPRCKAPQEAPSIEGGTKKACTACGQRLQVPAAPAAAPAAPKPSLLNKTMVASDEGSPAAPPIKYNCPACKKPLESPASEGGVKKPCPACGQRHQVPAAPPAGARPNPNKTMLVGDANGPQPVGGQPGYSAPTVAGAAPSAPAPTPGGTITIGSYTMSTRAFVLVVAAVFLFLLIVVPAVIRGGKADDPVAAAAQQKELDRAKEEVEQRKGDVERMNQMEANAREQVKNWADKQRDLEQKMHEDHIEAMGRITDQQQRDKMELQFKEEQRQADLARQKTEEEQKKLLADQKAAADAAKAELAAAQAKQQTIIQQPAPVVYYPPYSWRYYSPWGW